MKPAPFDYHRPDSVLEALELLADEDRDVKVLAGGQSLLTLMNLRLARPDALVDVGRLRELDRVFEDEGRLVIGALTTHRTVETHRGVAAGTPLLAAAAREVAHVGIRHRGTLGGTLAHADPAAELPAALVCLGGTLHVESAARGRREIAAEEFFVSVFTSALQPDELVTWVSVPTLTQAQGWGFRELAHRPGDYALAGAAVTVRLDDAGLVAGVRGGLLSAADRTLAMTDDAAYRGGEPGPQLWHAVADDWAARAEPIGDDPEHARALCRTAVVEALADAHARALASTAPEEARR